MLGALASCSGDVFLNDEPNSTSPDGKIPIELSVGGVDAPAMTRTVVTDGTGKTLNPFDVDTKIFMVMKSEYDTGNPDFAGAQTTKYNVARGDVTASSTTNITVGGNIVTANNVVFNSKNQRYWDDAHARSSMLSIYAYAQKGQAWTKCTFNGNEKDTEDASQPWAWTTTEVVPTILVWRATHQVGTEAQNQQSVQAQDLLFSNNLANNDTDPSTNPSMDKRLKFNFTTRKFPQVGEANMIFYHAMSKITIKIIEGDGFDKTSANKANDFKFTTTGGNIILKQFNHTGTFNIKQGEFTSIATNGTTDIPSIYLNSTNTSATGTEPHYVLEALVVPSIANNGMSRIVDERKSLTDDVMMEFAIDNSLYKVTHEELYEALRGKTNATMKSDNGNYIPLEAGKNYVFTFTVGKQKINNITAQVAEWENVDADNVDPSNARIELQLEERGSDYPSDGTFSLYRSTANYTADGIDDGFTAYDWKTGYAGNVTIPSHVAAAGLIPAHWTTSWYWESNKHFYHFRTLAPTTVGVTTDTENGDYTTLTSAVDYTDVRWGAPMLDDGKNEDHGTFKWNYGPTTNGFDANDEGAVASGLPDSHQIYKAIGPTKDPVKLILFHMMSDLTFKIKTTSGTDAVTLVDGSSNKTKVEIVGFYPGGKVLLGNGLVMTTGSTGTQEVAWDSESPSGTHVYKYGAVPQDLTSVKLRITTPDHNQYIVDLWDEEHPITATVTNNNIANPYEESSTAGKYLINRWYPGFKYTYSFTLAKTGITNLQATIVDWENVTADDEIIKIQ